MSPLHERHAPPEHRAGDQHAAGAPSRWAGARALPPARSSRGRRPRGVPAEGSEALGERREVEHVARVAERLLAVDVDDRDEVGEPVVGGEHDRLPDRALVALARRSSSTNTPPDEPCSRAGKRGTGADRQALAERAGREVDARRRRARGAPRAPCRRAQKVASSSSPISRPLACSAAYRASAAWPLERMKRSRSGSSTAADPEHAAVEGGEDVDDRERRADVANAGGLRSVDDSAPNARRQPVEIRCGSHRS